MTPVVIKLGGAVLERSEALQQLFAALKPVAAQRPLIVVHGGGFMVEQQLTAMGIQSEKKAGLRITPPAHMAVIAGALGGTCNKQLTAMALASGYQAVGLCLGDALQVGVEPLDPELGCVGQCTDALNPALLTTLTAAGFTPVISSIAIDAEGNLFNVNADQAAVAIAKMVNGELILLSDVEGILDADKALIEEIDSAKAEALIADGVIRDGMIVKVKAALDAAQTLRRSIAVASWKQPHHLVALLEGKPAGTRVLGE